MATSVKNTNPKGEENKEKQKPIFRHLLNTEIVLEPPHVPGVPRAVVMEEWMKGRPVHNQF